MAGQEAPDVRVLAAISAIAPLSMVMYLAAWPNIAASFLTNLAEIQQSLSYYLIGFGAAQLIYGPLSDSLGRRPIIFWGSLIFVLSSVMLTMTDHIENFVWIRLLQGIGACAGPVMARAIVRDCHERDEASRVLSLLMFITMFVPLVGPSIGGELARHLSWRAIFLIQGIAGLLASCFVLFRSQETLSLINRRKFTPLAVLSGYGTLLRSRLFMGYGMAGAFTIAGVFVYLAAAPHVLMTVVGVPTEQFGFYFSVNVVMQAFMALMNSRMVVRFGAEAILRFGLSASIISGAAMVFGAIYGNGWYHGAGLPLILFMSSLPLIGGNSIACALTDFPELAGSGTALIGALQMGIGALFGMILTSFENGTTLPLSICISICASLATLSYVVLIFAWKDDSKTPLPVIEI